MKSPKFSFSQLHLMVVLRELNRNCLMKVFFTFFFLMYFYFLDEIYYVDENGILLDRSAVAAATATNRNRDPRTIEFNFLDNTNICCGICGEVVPYELLMSEHLPTQHPDVLGDGVVDLEEIPYEVCVRVTRNRERKS